MTKAREKLPPRVERYGAKLGVSPIDAELEDLSGEWETYRNDEIVLHWRLILAPTDVQDYVIVHELAHGKHNDHSDRFWNTVGTIIPDYEERREWLRLNGNALRI